MTEEFDYAGAEWEEAPPPHSEQAQKAIDEAMTLLQGAESEERYNALGRVFEAVAAAKGFTPEEFVDRLLPLRWGGDEW